MNIKYTIVTLFFLAQSVLSLAQEKWTLDACIAYATANNLQLNDFEYANAATKESYAQSIRNLLPSVAANTRYIINFGRSTDPFTNDIITTDFFSNNYSLDGSIDLFQGFQKMNAIKASKFLYKATQEEVVQQKFLLAFRVMQAFYDIVFFEGLVAISEEQVKVSQENYDLVQKQVALGLKAGADVYEAESLLLTDRLNLTQSKNQLATAKLALIQEMNLEKTATIEIQKEIRIATVESSNEEVQTNAVYNEARAFVPLLKGQEFRAKAAKKQVAVSKGRLYPSLSLFGGIGTGYFETTRDTLGSTLPFRSQFRDNTFQYIGLQLSVPITNGWSARSAVKLAKIASKRAENNLKIQEQVLFQTIQQLVQEHNSLKAEVAQSNKNVEAQTFAFTIATKRYEKGLINALELFTAKNLFASAQNQNLQVQLRLQINKTTLDFYKGLPVFNVN